jgi:D-glycero-D-manno-heptose 1,7-bisphosphate phosphatase
MKTSGQKAFFFDRDGVINVDHGYVSKAENFDFMEGIFPFMRLLAGKGYLLIIVTNQAGIGRGYYTEEDFRKLTGWMTGRFAEEGIQIAGVYRCPHHPDEKCSCRKPEPGMFLQAIRDHQLDPDLCWMLGDKVSDLQAAEAAGIRNRVLLGGAESVHSTHTVSTLSELLKLPV